MRVIHVVPAISEEASGPSYSVVRLCDSLIKTGAEVQLATLDSGAPRVGVPYLKTFALGAGPRRLGLSPAMHRWLSEQSASESIDFLHNHSLWMMPNVYAGWVTQHGRARLVVTPRGTLSTRALRVSAIQKKIFWHLLQAPALRETVCFHATGDREYEDIRRLGFRQPVCVLPNGIDVPAREEPPPSTRPQLLFLGRLHPIKGIDVLLRAWQAVEGQFPEWDLRVAGPDNGGHLKALQAMTRQLRLQRVAFGGPVFGNEKLRAYRAASLFVLPTHSENFGMTVAEALATGTPVIVTKGAPWAGLEKEGAGWWIDVGVDPLVACLEEALATPPTELAEMGKAGRAWMARDFGWDQIGQQLSAVYRWLLIGGDTPPCIKLD